VNEYRQNGVIGFVLKGYPRLSETFVINEILLLEELGFKLHIFAMRRPEEPAVHDSVRRVRANVTYIPDYFWRYCFAFLQTNLRLWWRQRRLFGQAFRFALSHSLKQRTVSTLKRFLQAGYLVQKSLPGTDVKHWHAHFCHDPTTMTFFASWLSGISYSFSAHAKDIYLQDREFLRWKFSRARFAVTCTEHNRQYLEQIAGSVSVLRCYHGIDLNFFAKPTAHSVKTVPRILSVGRLVPKKGFSVLIAALHLLRQKGLDFSCTIIGSGPLKSELRKQITRLALGDHVELLAPVSQLELRRHYETASLFALACEVQEDGDRDGIPNVIVEAMAMGLPVVSTNISGIPECVDHGVNGLLAPARNPQSLADAMAAIINHPELARQFGVAGRKKIEQYFNARKNVEHIGAALRQVFEDNMTADNMKTRMPTGAEQELTHVS
jgi:glycosyltransferase involved in cell wall biosynthesis